ncbi:MAG: DUF368 domain-containing protein [Oscillospiraceae bacterium]
MKKEISVMTAVKGLIVGGSMTIPGVSGGTTALILGIYYDLIHAINHFRKEFKKSALLLAVFCAGAGLGIVGLSYVMKFALQHFELPTTYLFIGAILGGVPLLVRESKIRRDDTKGIVLGVLFGIIGVAIVLALERIPQASSEFGAHLSPTVLLMQLVTGIIIAVALVLPGISTSHMLLILGMYETTITAAKNPFHNIGYLLSLVIATVVGIFLITGVLEKAMTKAPQVTYFVIIGFVLGSIKDILDEVSSPRGFEIAVCALAVAVGYCAIRLFTKMGVAKEETSADVDITDGAASE